MHYTVAMKNTFILQIEAFPSDVIGHLFSHLILVRVVACAVTETKCPLLTALFSLLSLSLLSLSPPGYFSPRRGYRRVPKFCMGF